MWQKRCLIVAPVLAFVMMTLLLSCGGSSSNSTPAPTSTPITLIGIKICAQAPSTVALCTPLGTTEIFLHTTNNQVYAQGAFSSNGMITFQDISDSATWFVNNSLLTSDGGGFFAAGTVVGCTCVTAASGTVVSPPLLVGVGQSPTNCSLCPQSPP